MSLMLFIDRKPDRVIIVRWFRDPKFNIDYASGPFAQMDNAQFREAALGFIHRHFEEYDQTRLPEEKIKRPFQPGEAKKMFKKSAAVFLWKDNEGKLCLGPVRINRSDPLMSQDMGPENHRRLPANFTDVDFWKTFEEVLALAD
jgi:hypothetical protein